MNFSVCVPSVFAGKDFPTSMEQLAQNGHKAVEFWGLWTQNIAAISEARRMNGLSVIGLCTRSVPLTDPTQRQLYLDGLRETIELCKELNCRTIISQVGADQGTSGQHASIVEGLKAAVPLLREHALSLVIEPLNPKDHPGYYLRTSEEAFRIIEEVGAPEIKVLFDIYHQQITEGNLLEHILPNLDKIGHFHLAGVPERNEPVASEINYPFLLKQIEAAGYQGYFGLEYFPKTEVFSSLSNTISHLTKE